MVADLHALIGRAHLYEEKIRTIREIISVLKALDINYRIYCQSDNDDHLKAYWYLSSLVPTGLLNTMTGFRSSHENSRNLGLYAYPVLMAADIYIHNPDAVPVGEDQEQHLEFFRKIAKKLDFISGIRTNAKGASYRGLRIMDLREPTEKMSKSSTQTRGIIYLDETEETTTEKIIKSVTSNIDLLLDDSPGTSNLKTLANLLGMQMQSY
jgi:tryptophanyl-tRNA synthetase